MMSAPNRFDWTSLGKRVCHMQNSEKINLELKIAVLEKRRNFLFGLLILQFIVSVGYFIYKSNNNSKLPVFSAENNFYAIISTVALLVIYFIVMFFFFRTSSQLREYRVLLGILELKSLQNTLEDQINQSPEKVLPAWSLAAKKFEDYNSENFTQVKQIYTFSIWFMAGGFVLISFGVLFVLFDPERISLAIVSGTAGIIIEFLGTVVLSYYKTLLSHSMNYIRVLDRTSKVGVALQILDTLSSDAPDEKKEIIKTKIHIAKRLFSDAGLSETHREVQETARATNSIESIVGTGID